MNLKHIHKSQTIYTVYICIINIRVQSLCWSLLQRTMAQLCCVCFVVECQYDLKLLTAPDAYTALVLLLSLTHLYRWTRPVCRLHQPIEPAFHSLSSPLLPRPPVSPLFEAFVFVKFFFFFFLLLSGNATAHSGCKRGLLLFLHDSAKWFFHCISGKKIPVIYSSSTALFFKEIEVL